MSRKRILIVNSGCLKVNCSANLCHIAYIQGFLDNDCEVVVISKSSKGQNIDNSLYLPESAKYYEFDGSIIASHASEGMKQTISYGSSKSALKDKMIKAVKWLIGKYYGPMGISNAWINNVVRKFYDKIPYDLVLTLSGPVPSHLAGAKLIEKERVKTQKFCELWEDPWQLDLFNTEIDSKKVALEEKITSLADKVLYVSPITLKNQQQMFSSTSNKMEWLPLPYYYIDNRDESFENHTYGYFGDYYPQSRNIIPFYEAAKKLNSKTFICGNPNNIIDSYGSIVVKPRLPLSELKKYEDATNVLVFVCNLRGGQIPGKIYQYAATKKKVLFILDGTADEQEVLKNYFEQFNRFYFCENNTNSIIEAMRNIESEKDVSFNPVDSFSPKKIAEEILNMCTVQ